MALGHHVVEPFPLQHAHPQQRRIEVQVGQALRLRWREALYGTVTFIRHDINEGRR